MKIKKIIRSISAPKETSGVLWVSPEGFNYFEEGVWKLVDDATFTDIYNKVANKADKADLPNDVGRTATDVGFAHVEGGNVEYLFWLRQADSTKAGAMTAPDKVKLDALPTNASLTTLLDNKQNKYLVESTTVPLTGCGLLPNPYRNYILESSTGDYQLITPIFLHTGDKVTVVCSRNEADIYFSTNAFVEGLEVTKKVNYATPGTYTYTADEDGYYGFATVGTITSIIKEGVITVEDKLDTLTPYEEILYADLVTKRNSGTLNPGTLYRITDYVTTTTQTNTQSANHPFDIIVLATGTNTLSEDALAIQHEGDTYFANSNLSAWELKYTLNNDTAKYMWADTTNGKGVIYYMKDEYNNECPYDFKNIQFKWSEAKPVSGIVANRWYYTFSLENSNVVIDFSINRNCCNNKIKRHVSADKASLNFIVFRSISSSKIVRANVLDYNCHHNTFNYNCQDNIFGHSCANNTFGSDFINNTFGNTCGNNILGNNCLNSIFRNLCSYNTFDVNCTNNTFGINCSNNILGKYNADNTFGNSCSHNTFGDSCSRNTFGNSCSFNQFGVSCRNNIFDKDCQDNIFVGFNSDNIFGNYSSGNELKNMSCFNYFGKSIYNIVINGNNLHIDRVSNEGLEFTITTEAVFGNNVPIPLLLSDSQAQNFSVIEAYTLNSPAWHTITATGVQVTSLGGLEVIFANTFLQGPVYLKLAYSGGGCCGSC